MLSTRMKDDGKSVLEKKKNGEKPSSPHAYDNQ